MELEKTKGDFSKIKRYCDQLQQEKRSFLERMVNQPARVFIFIIG